MCAAAAILATIALFDASAAAQSARTFVSGHGADTNPCTLAQPCRGFQHAHDLTSAGGEITVLDPAGYGPVTITKAISIVNDGVGEAGITVSSQGSNAVTINAGTGDVVNLRGLTLVGGGLGGMGILFSSGGTLNVQNCAVGGFVSDGIRVAVTGAAAVSVLDTTMLRNGNNGINIKPGGSGAVSVYLGRVAAIGNAAIGIFLDGSGATGTLQATAADSLASGNAGLAGFGVSSAPNQAAATFTLVRSTGVGNAGAAFAASGQNATMALSLDAASGDGSGYGISGGATIKSFGNNRINDASNAGTLTAVALQ